MIPQSALPGVFLGSFSILGGATNTANDVQASQPLSVTVGTPSPVPEASTTASLGLLLAVGGLVVAAKRKKAGASL